MQKNFIFSLIFIAISCGVDGQNHQKIEDLLSLSRDRFIELNFIGSIEVANEALKLSKSENYSRGITMSNIYIAKVLSETGIFKKALEYLDAAERETYFSEYINAQVEIRRIKGRAYSGLGMYELGVAEFYKQLKVSEQIIESESMKYKSMFWAHQNLAIVFAMMDESDSVWTHLMAQKKILNHRSLKSDFYDFSTAYTAIGSEYTYHHKFSKAREHLDSAKLILEQNKSPYLYGVYSAYGDLEAALGNQEKAIEYYELALQNSIENKNKLTEKINLKALADFYFKNELDLNQTNVYLSRYQKLNDSLNLVNSQAIDLLVHRFLNKEEASLEKAPTKNWKVIAVLFFISIGVVLFLFRKNYQKKIKLSYFKDQLNEKEDLVETLVKESNGNKLNELMELAKNNDPQFILLFEELYPDVLIKLRAKEERIRISELTFCAMIYLNFSTKEIAEYTFVTVRAVQIRKNRFRKKHQIDSMIDLGEWMRNL